MDLPIQDVCLPIPAASDGVGESRRLRIRSITDRTIGLHSWITKKKKKTQVISN